MELDNLATFASFVSQFTPIKILPWQEKKDNNYDTDDNDKLRQEFEMWMSKTFLSSQWCTHDVTKADAHNLGDT